MLVGSRNSGTWKRGRALHRMRCGQQVFAKLWGKRLRATKHITQTHRYDMKARSIGQTFAHGLCSWAIVWIATLVFAPACRAATARFPESAAWVAERLVIVCRNGVLASWNPLTHRLEHTLAFGGCFTAIAPIPGTDQFLVTDAARHEVWHMACDSVEGFVLRQRLAAPHTPRNLAHHGSYVAVAGLWARQVALYEWVGTAAGQKRLEKRYLIDLSFAPGSLCWDRPTGMLLVGDAFSDRVAVVRPEDGAVVARRRLPGMSLRDVACDEEQATYYFLATIVHPFLPADREQVFWGNVVQQVVLGVRREQLFPSQEESGVAGPTDGENFRRVTRWSLWSLGQPKTGSGDPEALLRLPHDQFAVALGGRGEILLLDSRSGAARRVSVGSRPVALVEDGEHRQILVVNKLSHDILVVDTQQPQVRYRIALASEQPVSEWELGERLFFDAGLSLDGWMSCHTCHVEGHMLPVAVDNLGDGSYGAAKRVLSLLGLAGTAPFAWDGSQPSLASQLAKSVATTMHGTAGNLSAGEWQSLLRYVESLPPAPGIASARQRAELSLVAEGRRLFQERRCTECHPPPYYTVAGRVDVGLEDQQGRRHFNPPSLLGVSQRDAWLHDGRARSLSDVFRRFGHPQNSRYGEEEIDALLAFLMTL
ncbi:MAG: hypothetical protein KatS3mg109_1656 [Pirellulaceae bacterium]|nr:MAG: hypothetical protein KatS3mg109_1656 [Pirellulaceae bacterium]